MHLLKQIVNIPFRVLDKAIDFPDELEYPQSRMLRSIYARMMQAYRLDRLNGTFGCRPDGNMERFLRVQAKILMNLSEMDRYYRAWLGLAFLLAQDEVAGVDASPETLKREIKRQWSFDVDFLADKLFEGQLKGDFVEIALCDCLGNMARMKAEEAEAFLNQENRVNRKGGKN
jgi:hypothetical protein